MKILVTGATSGLGRNAAEVLRQQGHEVRATGRDGLAGQALLALGAEFVALDLETASTAEYQALVADCDAVWHCAARSSPWGAWADFERANVQATTKLAMAAGQAGIGRFVHISTPAIYFDFQHHVDIDEDYRARHFANHYAKSKFLAEQAVLQCVGRYPATTYVMLRPRGLFGPHDRVILPRVLAQITRDGGVLRLPRGGAARLDLTFVLNVVQSMLLATQAVHLKSGDVFNITNQEPELLSVMLKALLHEQLGLRYRVQAMPYPLLHAVAAAMEGVAAVTGKEPMLTRYSVGAVNFDMSLNQQRAQQQLAYVPQYTLAQGIAMTGAWWREQQENPWPS